MAAPQNTARRSSKTGGMDINSTPSLRYGLMAGATGYYYARPPHTYAATFGIVTGRFFTPYTTLLHRARTPVFAYYPPQLQRVLHSVPSLTLRRTCAADMARQRYQPLLKRATFLYGTSCLRAVAACTRLLTPTTVHLPLFYPPAQVTTLLRFVHYRTGAFRFRSLTFAVWLHEREKRSACGKLPGRTTDLYSPPAFSSQPSLPGATAIPFAVPSVLSTSVGMPGSGHSPGALRYFLPACRLHLITLHTAAAC